MSAAVRLFAWLLCVVYSTIPAFWLSIHPLARFWRSFKTSPYKILLPLWIASWLLLASVTAPWRNVVLYDSHWVLLPAAALFLAGFALYRISRAQFSFSQLAGIPELRPGPDRSMLVTSGIRSRMRHPIYLAHLCELLAWSLVSGLLICWALTLIAVATGALMIAFEDRELEKRFGEEYSAYRREVGAIFPRWTARS